MLGLTIHKSFLLPLMLISLLFSYSSGFAFAKETQYSQTARDWLIAHPVIRVAVSSDYAPISYLDEKGQHIGISAEYLQQIETRLKAVNSNFKFQIVTLNAAEKATNDPLKKA